MSVRISCWYLIEYVHECHKKSHIPLRIVYLNNIFKRVYSISPKGHLSVIQIIVINYT